MATAAPAAAPAKPTFPAYAHMSKEPRLKDKVCVISGASRGFGQAIAVRFVEEGARVALLSRTSCDETLGLISKIEGVPAVDSVAVWVQCDLGTEAEVKAAVSGVTAKFGEKINVLVNNAALFVFHSIETVRHVALIGVDMQLCTVHAGDGGGLGPQRQREHPGPRPADEVGAAAHEGRGRRLHRVAGQHQQLPGAANCATYSVMKAAITQMSRNCAYDFAKYGIRSNSVCAGTIETPISVEERKAHGWSYEHWESLKTKDVMMGRVGNVREIANATLFLACDESSYVNAADLMVDGGQVPCTVME